MGKKDERRGEDQASQTRYSKGLEKHCAGIKHLERGMRLGTKAGGPLFNKCRILMEIINDHVKIFTRVRCEFLSVLTRCRWHNLLQDDTTCMPSNYLTFGALINILSSPCK